MNQKLLILLSGIFLLNPMLLPAMEKEGHNTSEEKSNEESRVDSLKKLAIKAIAQNPEKHNLIDLWPFNTNLSELISLPKELAVPLIYKLPQDYINRHAEDIMTIFKSHKHEFIPEVIHALAARLPSDHNFHPYPHTNFSELPKKLRKEVWNHLNELPRIQSTAILHDSPNNIKKFILVAGLMSEGTVDIPTAQAFINNFYETKLNDDFAEIYYDYFPEEILKFNKHTIALAFVDGDKSLAEHFESFERMALVHLVGMKFIELEIKQKLAAIQSLFGNDNEKISAKIFKKQLKLFVRCHRRDLQSLSSESLQKHFEKKYNQLIEPLNINTTGLWAFGVGPFKAALKDFIAKNISNRRLRLD